MASKKKRKARRPMPGSAGPAAEPPRERAPEPPPRRLRGQELDDKIREELEPLAPGERPTVITVAAIVCLGFAVANVAVVAAGVDIGDEGSDDEGNALVSTLMFAAIQVAAAVGMWHVKYWAVLGFQALLALQIIFISLAALIAPVWAMPIIFAMLVPLGFLFVKLVRAMARVQMPRRPGAPPAPPSDARDGLG